MGARGPLPQSAQILQIRGNPGQRPPKVPVRPRPAIPPPPTTLSREAKAEWKRITPELDELGLLAKMDRAILALYCTWWSRWCDLNRQLARDTSRNDGLVVTGHHGVRVKHPAWSMFKDATEQTVRLAKELGITPLTRLRMDLPSPVGDDDDDRDGILD